MNKEILQIIFLTSHSKAFLEGKIKGMYKNPPLAYNYRNIRFVSHLPSDDENEARLVLAKNPNDWLAFLHQEGVLKLHLTYQPSEELIQKASRPLISSVKGRHWHVITEKENGCDVWRCKWQLDARKEVMSYYYLFLSDVLLGEFNFPSLEMSKLYLKEILNDLVTFTIKNELANWTTVFKKALRSLDSKKASDLIAPDILPSGCYSLAARQVLSACAIAWVFGGMGSWNDVTHVHDYDLYRRLSANLYNTICDSIVSVVNSFPLK